MASQDDVDNTLRWVADEQHIHACAPYGENNATVTEELSAQRHRVKMVHDYQKNMDAFKDDPKARDLSVHEAYEALQEVASKRMHCLEDIQEIAALEPLFGKLTNEFATKASKLVEAEAARAAGKAENQSGEGVAQAAQNCILAVRANWCWISKLVKCADTHLGHVSDYHQFFHTAAEYSEWMPVELQKVTSKVATKEMMNADKEEADELHKDLMEVLTMFLHWHGKTQALFDKSCHVVPVHLRARKLDYFRPVVALCDYKTKEVTVREGEELTLLDNSDSQSWKVRNLNNTEAQVPAVVLVIPGPEPTAVQAAGNLRLQLLGIWTDNVKRIGKSLIWFMIICNNDWKDDEIKKLKAMTNPQKDDLRRCLGVIEETLGPHWADYKGFRELLTRMTILRDIIAQDGDAKDRDADFSNGLVLKFNTLEELLKRYKDLWSQWDTFRVIVETCRSPEFLLIAEKWQQLKYMGMDDLRSRWHTGFGFSDEDQDEFASWLERWLRTITTTTTVTEEITAESASQLGSAKQVSGSEQVTTSEQEEKRTFIITGVMDPATEKEITMQEAVSKGIINSQTGCYCNTLTGESWPIPVAMNAGFIKVEFTTTKKTAEKRRDIGLITIKTQRESRPYTVKAVVDAKTERRLTVDEAISAGILDQKNGTYYNAVDDMSMSLADAIDSNLLLVEYDRNAEVGEPEIFNKTYAIHSVVDQQAKKTVTFSQAIRKGLLDRETAAYYHNITGEYTYVGDAIKRGFIKATVVKDPNSMDIDPENKLVVEHLQNIRKKLLNPMKAIATLRKAAAAEAGK